MILPINHICTTEKKFDDFDAGELWRHMMFRVYRHASCPETGMKESYLPILTCNDFKSNFKGVLQAIKNRYPNLDEVLGEHSHIRYCTTEDEFLLTRQMITQATLISFNPNRSGRGSFLNRRLIKSKLPMSARKYVNLARKLPLYKFKKEEIPIFDNEDKIHRFWQLCNESEYIGKEIEEFFVDKIKS